MDPNGAPHIQIDAETLRKTTRGGCGCGIGILILVILLSAIGPYTEYLWYKHDIGHPEVMTIRYGSQGTLFVFGFLISLGVFYLSLRTALNQSMIFFDRPITLGQRIITNAMGWVQDRGSNLIKIIATVFALFSGLGFSAEWQTMLLSGSGGKFGKVDPLLGMDLGFFVFQLPWYRAIANFAFGLMLTTAIVTVVLYVLLQMLATLAKIELGRPKIRLHVSILIAATALTYGAQTWLKTFEFGTMASAQFTGAGYAAMSELAGMRIVAVVSILAAIVTLLSVRSKIPFRAAIASGVVLGAFYIVGVILIPVVIQRVVVDPDKINKEGPYAKNAIEMTRFAYELDKVAVRDFGVADAPTPEEVKAAESTLANMRLWDPEILRQAAEQSQTFRRYYSFHDVDLDRYMIDGKPTMVMLAPRDIRVDGLDANARSWVNTRLQYTHGYGVIASPVNTSGASGQPSFLVKDIPISSPPSLKVDEPRVYFSDYRDENLEDRDEYALVNTKVDEFDYIVEEKTVTNRWTGKRGIPISGFMARLAFSIKLGDGNLLVSGNINSDSRLLIRRSVLERASKVFPFLTFDQDPYLVIHNGRLVWILDGYTTTSMIPYSDRNGEEATDLNYIRNSVKVVIDAYSGDCEGYALKADEPILNAYRKIYPKLIQDFSKFPKGLEAHLRYPEDQLRMQALMLRQYHVVDPASFLNNGDAWDIPNQRWLNNEKTQLRPYYVLMRLPNESKDGFMQILPFSPRQKGNMAGWLAAHCDPGDLGKLVLYKFTRGSLIPGPELMESNFNQNETISNLNRQLQNEQSDIIVGNLLVIPIGKSVMYVEPLFLKGRGLQAIPELRKVILALKGKIVVGDTYQQALEKLFGPGTESGQSSETIPTDAGAPPKGQAEVGAVREALKMLDEADAALRQGEFARYGELQRKARAKLRTLTGASSLPQ